MSKKIGFRKKTALGIYSNMNQERVSQHELRTLFWECTLRCNLSCRHCGSDCKVSSAHKDMPAEDFLKAIDSITPHVDPNRVMVVFTGGEALMRKDLENVGLELYNRGYPWGLVTNGMMLDESRMEALLRSGLHSITVSIDGFAENHNYIRRNERSFDNALRALRLMVKAPEILYDVVTCVNQDNFASLTEFRDFLISEGVESWRLFTIFPVGRAAEDPRLQLPDEQFVELLEFIKQTRKEGKINVNFACEGFLGSYEGEVRDQFYHCSAGVTTGGIRVDGEISGCTSIRAHYDQGNIYKDDFMDVWNSRFEKFRNREWMKKDSCEKCKVFRYCLGGGMHLRDECGDLLVCHYDKLK